MDRPKLLVMDDEAMFGAFVEEVAQGLGHDVLVLTEPGKFFEAFNSFQPATIVLDMVMPEFDGTEITRWLVEEKFAGKLIMVTGYNPQYSKIAKLLGELGGLHKVVRIGKPVRLEELRRVLMD
ncbi:MAG: response regulator [Alphaproteobacteria bacterium]